MQYDIRKHKFELFHHVRDSAADFCGGAGLFDDWSIIFASVSDNAAAEAEAAADFNSIDAACPHL